MTGQFWSTNLIIDNISGISVEKDGSKNEYKP